MTGDRVSEQETVQPCPNWGDLTVSSVLKRWAETRGDRRFLTVHDGPSLTFAQSYQRVMTLSSVFRSQGFGPRDTIALRAGRSVDGLLALLAGIHAGLDVCLIPEGLSVRQATDGAVAFAPKVAIDAGDLSIEPGDNLRIMDLAAGMFTVRFVGCFGDAPDGLVDLNSLVPVDPAEVDPVLDSTVSVHAVQIGADGKVMRSSRDQSQLMAQALASASACDFTPNTNVATPYDLISSHGLLAVALPALLVGCQLTLFDPLEADLERHIEAWSRQSDERVAALPLSFAQKGTNTALAREGRRIWIGRGAARVNPDIDGQILIDLGGRAILPADQDADGQLVLCPGEIVVSPKVGDAMSFGTLRLEGSAQANAGAVNLMSGELALESVLSARINGRTSHPQPTGVLARLQDTTNGKPVYVVTDRDSDDIQVGQTYVSIAAINRALGLTGRWQDAGAFAVKDTLLGYRVEVAVRPRTSDDQDSKIPTLDMVRDLLCESGIGDAGLPVRMHLVTRIPMRGRGVVDVDALADLAWETDEPLSDELGNSLDEAAA